MRGKSCDSPFQKLHKEPFHIVFGRIHAECPVRAVQTRLAAQVDNDSRRLCLSVSLRLLLLIHLLSILHSAPRHPGQLFLQTVPLQLFKSQAEQSCGAENYPPSTQRLRLLPRAEASATPPWTWWRGKPTHTGQQARLHRGFTHLLTLTSTRKSDK